MNRVKNAMNKHLNIKKIKKLIFIFVLLFSTLIMFSCIPSNDKKREIHSIFELNDENITIGVGTGSNSLMLAEKELSKAKILIFTDESLGYNAVKVGQIDAYVFDRIPLQKVIKTGFEGVKILDDNLTTATRVAIGLSKNPRINNIKELINQKLKELRDEGIIDEMYNRWVIEENEEMPDIKSADNPTMELIVGTTGTIPPFTFYKGDTLTGFDIELVERIVAKLNAKITYKVYDFDSIVMALVTNDIDIASGNLNVTEERAESIDYSDVIYENYVTALVRDYDEEKFDTISFFKDLHNSFSKTFIRENRYELFISGILCTLRITFFSILFETILGFILFLICYNTGNNVNSVIKIIFWLLRRVPIVVMLMVFYYIIFSKMAIDSQVVATFVFIIIFSAEVAELLINTINNIDKGQFEAAYALGFGKEKTFFKILLPQTFPIMYPTFKNMIVELVRSTAVVGYIAVQDLTKVGDIVRSRTYDAFFPLIAIAIIYVILAEFLIMIIERFKNARGLGKESKYLKGVKRND